MKADRPLQRLPLTAAQYGIWLGQQLDPASPAYWTAEIIELSGDLDRSAFKAAVRTVIHHSDALHARVTLTDGTPWQSTDRRPWSLQVIDFSKLAHPEAAAHSWMDARLAQPADLQQGPLFCTALIQLGPCRYWWYLQVHHLALDGFGYGLLTRSVAEHYAALTTAAPTPILRPAALQAVVAEDQHYQLSGPLERDRDFWQQQLAGAPTPVLLAPPQPLAHGVLRHRGQVAAQRFNHWKKAANHIPCDWSHWLLAAIAGWIARQTGQTDLTLGLPAMNRMGSAALAIPCMAMNIVPLRLTVNPHESIRSLAQQVANLMRQIRLHQRYRYEWLRQDLGLTGSTQRLFGAVLNLMPFDRPLEFGALSARVLPVSAGPVEDLAISMAPSPEGLRLDLEANPSAYRPEQLVALHASLLSALEAFADQPEAPMATLLPAPTLPRAQLHGPALTAPPTAVIDALRQQAATRPDQIALEHDGKALSYQQLLVAVQSLAGQLAARGVGGDSRVALLLPRTSQTVVALLAVLWAGAAYLPLDPNGPASRIADVLADARPQLVLTVTEHAALASPLPTLYLDAPSLQTVPALAEPVAIPADGLAYIIYTSGTTGRPNGVLISHAALAHFVASASQRYAASPTDRILQFAPLHFDASVEEIFVALCNGATLVLRNDAMLESLPQFVATCADWRISVLDLPTAFWHELAFYLESSQSPLPTSLRLVIIGGEAALAERVRSWRQSAPATVRLLNTYGPTEATVIATTAELAGPEALDWDGDSVPIGTPLPGVSAVVVDAQLNPVAPGEAGELCLFGGALALGYFEREDVTQRRFVSLHTLPDQPRAYRTGDRALLAADGQLRYLGRLDDEFKISGYRIDPAEVETALLAWPGVREAAVVGQLLAHGNKRLLAFLVVETALPPMAELRAFLAEHLPAPALPGVYTAVERLPRNANGKIDRHALRLLPLADTSAEVVATELEQQVMAVWNEVLGFSQLSPASDFFMLGGKSLQAIQLANRLAMALEREVTASMLFRHPTVAALAAALQQAPRRVTQPSGSAQAFDPLLTIQTGTGRPLFCVHPTEGLGWAYFALTRHLPDLPMYALQARGLTETQPARFEEMVSDYVAQIRAVQPQGPYRLLGWSSGGGTAHAMAAELQAAGEQVELLALLDSYPPSAFGNMPEPTERDALQAMLDLTDRPTQPDDPEFSVAEILQRLRGEGSPLRGLPPQQLTRLTATALHTMRLYRQGQTRRYRGSMLLFRASRRTAQAPDWQSWQPLVDGEICVIPVEAGHSTLLTTEPLAVICAALRQNLDEKVGL